LQKEYLLIVHKQFKLDKESYTKGLNEQFMFNLEPDDKTNEKLNRDSYPINLLQKSSYSAFTD
jgi:hypothetical protein